MRELDLLVGLAPEEVLRRLIVAAQAEGVRFHGSAAGFRLEVPPGHDEEPTVEATGSLLPDSAGTRVRLSSAAPKATLHLFALFAGGFAAFGGFNAARYEGAGIPASLVAAAGLAIFFGGIVWIIGTATAGPATDRIRRFVRDALQDSLPGAERAGEPVAAPDVSRR
jgi:hypothetical protein